MLSVCDFEEKLYKLEFKGRLTDRYLINKTYTHLKFYSGKDTIQPYGWYSNELKEYIKLGDSLYKAPYDDSCTIFKRDMYVGFDTCLNTNSGHYHWFKRVIYDSGCECPPNERKRIRHELDSLRKIN